MKLLTLNTHSLVENSWQKKLNILSNAILKEKFDIMAFQEVNQSIAAPFVNSKNKIKEDNYAYLLAKKLKEGNLPYSWVWCANHIGYSKFDEGLALFSRKPIEDIAEVLISKNISYENYKTRKVLGIKVEDSWYFCVHMGWWEDADDPFEDQWQKIKYLLKTPKFLNKKIYLMGDFNSPASAKNEGKELVESSGFYDTFDLAITHDDGITVKKNIDGWKESSTGKMRIDYIFQNYKGAVKSSKTIFNGKNYGVVSDHFGVSVFNL